MTAKSTGKDFIRQIISHDLEVGKNEGRICTRFPPEPNGYLHIGHALSICLNFGVAEDFDGACFLRFDDTNPAKEKIDFAEAIMKDIAWLGFDWENRLTHASDYFDEIYNCAIELIEDGHAYVDSQTAEEIKHTRGTLSEPGVDSPYRNRSVAENIGLFERMRSGEFDAGENVLRAKIDMSSPNINLRDPVIYRILRLNHQRTGSSWSIYPMYDFAHTLSDAIEGTTHSLCTLEFEDHRPLYEWFLDHLNLPNRPRQIEFSRLNLEHTITSKRKLADLVEQEVVTGWNDPRMPTLSGMRKRGYPASAIRDFCQRVGITKKDKYIEMASLENSVREELDRSAPRAMAVLNPLKITIENYPEGPGEEIEAKNHPKNSEMGHRSVHFGRELFIERDDFMEQPSAKFYRLQPGGEVRLRFAYIIECKEMIKDQEGNLIELICRYDPDTKSGTGSSTKKVKSAIHWVSATNHIKAQVNLYETLFLNAQPSSEADINPNSLKIIKEAVMESGLTNAKPEERFQFERNGYFILDREDEGVKVFNRIITLKDTWAKIKNN
jgi:glutaminyl-tRNA synthetase